jgi:hypothetical protein
MSPIEHCKKLAKIAPKLDMYSLFIISEYVCNENENCEIPITVKHCLFGYCHFLLKNGDITGERSRLHVKEPEFQIIAETNKIMIYEITDMIANRRIRYRFRISNFLFSYDLEPENIKYISRI